MGHLIFSAGIGRSGTYIALDYLVDQANVEGYVNLFQCVQNLRHQRVNMVQTYVGISLFRSYGPSRLCQLFQAKPAW